MRKALYAFVAAVLAIPVDAKVVKTNLLYDATSTVNLGVEFRLGGRTSLDIPLNYNPWEFGGNKKWKHFLAQPAVRIWTREVFSGHFFGIHSHWGYYNVGRLPISSYTKTHHFEGTLVGGGVSWGYRWNWGAWGLEAELGLGYARLDHDIYECGYCGDFIKHEVKNYFGPTKVALGLVYMFGGGGHAPSTAGTSIPPEGGGPLQHTLHGLTPTFVAPDPEGSKLRSDSIRADLEFVFDVARLDPAYRDNARELRRLHRAVEEVRRSRHIVINSIRVTGFASPEGTEKYNLTLSERRAASVRDYLENITDLPTTLFSIDGEGERPDGLRAMIEVDYVVEPFALDEIVRFVHSRPHVLSVEEMFRLACTYDPESKEYKEAFEIAAATFPNNDVANINAAAVSLLHGDVDAAGLYLERVRNQTPAWWDNVGIVFYLRGDLERAAVAFGNAGTTGLDNATTLRKITNQPTNQTN